MDRVRALDEADDLFVVRRELEDAAPMTEGLFGVPPAVGLDAELLVQIDEVGTDRGGVRADRIRSSRERSAFSG
jgi:hypothetical protein